MNKIDKLTDTVDRQPLFPIADRKMRGRTEICAFHEAIDYMVKLRRSGYINDSAFADLVYYAAATFVEAEIDRKVTQALEDRLLPDRVMGFLR